VLTLARRSSRVVSVVIPTHNYARYVGQAIRSALCQGYRPVDVIVVDDGSTDHTPAVLQEFAGAIDVVRLDGAGVSAARNAGLARARGEYIVLLDADDLLMPGGLAAQVRRLDGRPDIHAVIGEWYTYVVRADAAFRSRSFLYGADALPLLLRQNIVGTPSAILLRRAALSAAGGFDTSLSYAADWDMWLRLAKLGCRFSRIHRPVATYRVHGHSMTSNVDRAIRDVTAILDRSFGDPALPQPLRALEPRARFGMLMYLAYLCLQEGVERQAADRLREALRWNPGAVDTLPFYRHVVDGLSGPAERGERDVQDVVRSMLAVVAAADDGDGARGSRRQALRQLGAGILARRAGDRGRQRQHLRTAVGVCWRTAVAPSHLPWTLRLLIPGGMLAALRRRLARMGVRGTDGLPPALRALLADGQP
jgi:glycosyltransferase involved in cell wall biosynthesis